MDNFGRRSYDEHLCENNFNFRTSILGGDAVYLISFFFGSGGHFIRRSVRMYISTSKTVSEYDQEIPQSQTADNPVAS